MVPPRDESFSRQRVSILIFILRSSIGRLKPKYKVLVGSELESILKSTLVDSLGFLGVYQRPKLFKALPFGSASDLILQLMSAKTFGKAENARS
jgi:hypothetical protein